MSSRVTMSEMKRRVAAMFDFIAKTQVELAGEEETEAAAPTPTGEGQRQAKDRSHQASGPTSSGGRSPAKRATDDAEGETGSGRKDFTDLSCLEMMDCLTRDIVHWQSQFAA